MNEVYRYSTEVYTSHTTCTIALRLKNMPTARKNAIDVIKVTKNNEAVTMVAAVQFTESEEKRKWVTFFDE